jgi:hypothetical protein
MIRVKSFLTLELNIILFKLLLCIFRNLCKREKSIKLKKIQLSKCKSTISDV